MDLFSLIIGGGLIGFLTTVFSKFFDRITSKHDKKDKTSADIAELKRVQLEQSGQIDGLVISVDSLRNATMQDLRDRITRYCKQYIALGYIDPDDYANLKCLHDAYHRCGGNGFLDDLMQKVKNLPMVDK